MADKKPLVGPGGQKNIAAAKAAFGATTANGGGPSPQSRTRATEAAKTPDPKTPVAAKSLTGTAANAAAAKAPAQAAIPVKEEAVKPAPPATSAASQLAGSTALKSGAGGVKKQAASSDESSAEASSSEESSDEDSDEDSDASERRRASKVKKIDIGVSLSSIKAAFQQDDKARQQNVKKGYDVEEFKRQCKEAAERGGAGTEATVENEPTAQDPDVVKNAVQNDLGLDGIKSSTKDMKSRFENYSDSHAEEGKSKDELLLLKERSEVSGQKSKWENPENLFDKGPKAPNPDIEVAASKATKMKEKFEKKARKEEKKNKTPKPKSRTAPLQQNDHETVCDEAGGSKAAAVQLPASKITPETSPMPEPKEPSPSLDKEPVSGGTPRIERTVYKNATRRLQHTS